MRTRFVGLGWKSQTRVEKENREKEEVPPTMSKTGRPVRLSVGTHMSSPPVENLNVRHPRCTHPDLYPERGRKHEKRVQRHP